MYEVTAEFTDYSLSLIARCSTLRDALANLAAVAQRDYESDSQLPLMNMEITLDKEVIICHVVNLF